MCALRVNFGTVVESFKRNLRLSFTTRGRRFRTFRVLTPKSDVYSFGVVLLEPISRKKPVEFNTEINSAFDVGISNAENMQSLREIRKLSAKCLSKDVEMRPEIIDVLSSLIIIREHRHGRLRNPSPNNSTLSIEEEKEMKKMTRNYRRPFRKEFLQRLCIGVLGEDRLSIVKQLRTQSETDRNTFLKT
jgi:serine/threonine protein kinase